MLGGAAGTSPVERLAAGEELAVYGGDARDEGQQLAGARVTDGEVPRPEHAVLEARGELVAVQDAEDAEDAEDVAGATDEAEHLKEMHRVARPRGGQQFAEPPALKRVEAAGRARGLGEKRPAPRSPPVRTRSCRAVDRRLVETRS